MQAPAEAKGFRGPACHLAALALLTSLCLTGCSSIPDAVNPISWYRDLTGVSKNDDVGDKRNQKNLDAGGQEPYPNLGDVPEAPETAMSGIDRDALKDSLVADRENAKYTDEQLRAGHTAPGAPPSPESPAPVNASAAGSGAASSSAPASASPSSPPSAAPAGAQPRPAVAPTSPLKEAAATAPAVTSAPQAAPASPPPATSPPAPSPRSAAPPATGSEAPPDESPLTSPTVAEVPQGETPTPPPPPPQIPPPLPPVVAPPRQAAPPRQTAAVPAEQAAAAPTTAAPKSPRPQQQASIPPASALRRGPTISYQVADISFGEGSAKLPNAAGSTVSEIVKLYSENGGTIRVVGHGEAASGADAAINGFTLALDRAQAVEVALAEAGVPAKNIAVETAPVRGGGGRDVPRVEVYLER